jgi:hypothetical protein
MTDIHKTRCEQCAIGRDCTVVIPNLSLCLYMYIHSYTHTFYERLADKFCKFTLFTFVCLHSYFKTVILRAKNYLIINITSYFRLSVAVITERIRDNLKSKVAN